MASSLNLLYVVWVQSKCDRNTWKRMATTQLVRWLAEGSRRVWRRASSGWTTFHSLDGSRALMRNFKRVNSCGYTPNYMKNGQRWTVIVWPLTGMCIPWRKCINVIRSFPTCSTTTKMANKMAATKLLFSSSLWSPTTYNFFFCQELSRVTKNGACRLTSHRGNNGSAQIERGHLLQTLKPQKVY